MSRAAPASVDALQRWFQAAVMHPGGAEVAAEDRAIRRLLPARAKRLEDLLLPSAQMDARERLDVYAASYFLRLRDVLKLDFAGVAHALGDDAFDDLMREFVTRRPSTSFNLNDYGDDVPGFIARKSRVRAVDRRRVFLAELATLERAVDEVFHAPQAAPVALERLQSIPPDRWTDAVFVTIPALRLLQFGFPVNGYLQAVIDQTAPSIPARMPTWIAVYRKGWKPWRARLSREQFLLLRSLVGGKPLGAAIAAVVRTATRGDSKAARERKAEVLFGQLGAWFREWTAEGLFREIRVAA
ncbi:MAG TPA: DNA-binding domain-containing protein [Planctomycetota bacterium]|jgi:hypothetical protein|nr:DNA-binding domain-containing protein [Planctomycetota bacterium]